MKVEIVDQRKPDLKPGQLWKHINDNIYLATIVPNGVVTGSKLVLVNVDHFNTWWSREGGFGLSPDEFEYVGELKITP